MELRKEQFCETVTSSKPSQKPCTADLTVLKSGEPERRQLQMKYRSAYQVLNFLTNHADGMDAVICSHRVIAEATCLSVAGVKKALSYLAENHFINVLASGNARVYILKPVDGFTASDKLTHWTFSVKAVVSNSEQPSGIFTEKGEEYNGET